MKTIEPIAKLDCKSWKRDRTFVNSSYQRRIRSYFLFSYGWKTPKIANTLCEVYLLCCPLSLKCICGLELWTPITLSNNVHSLMRACESALGWASHGHILVATWTNTHFLLMLCHVAPWLDIYPTFWSTEACQIVEQFTIQTRLCSFLCHFWSMLILET